LRGIADLFLFHNRPILRRLDDSVAVVKPGAGGLQVWRRARGFVPEPVACLSQSLSGYRLGQGSRGAVVNGAVLGGKALNGAAVNGPALTRAVLNGAVLALGAEQNAAFAVLDPSSGRVYPGPHIGDLGTVELEFYMYEQLASFCELLGFTPAAVVVDPHPGYRSRLLGERLAAERDLKLQYVQHHEAHVAAVMAEEGWVGECLGLACDGTGWGSDGRIWGCELFAVDSLALPFRRLAHLQYLPLPGGETAIRRPWRLAAAYTAVLTPDLWPWLEARWPGRRRELRLIPRLVEGLPVQQPATSSLGRLFDAVAGLLGISEEVSYEGQAAMELEALAETIETVEDTVADTVVDTVGDTIAAATGWAEVSGSPGSAGPLQEELEVASLWRGLLTCLQQGRLVAEVALYFQQRVVEMLAGAVLRAAALTGYRRVALGGGCFHNRYLSRRLRDLFERAGFQVAEARRVSPGDGGLAVGQAVLAAARGKWGTASGSG
jgi:hydrogenase maturation protein HypF